jgi:type I restriction enzyme S subunit
MTVDSHVTIVWANPTKILPSYLGLYLSSQEREIESLSKGATGQTELSKDLLKESIVINASSLVVQQKIASILSAYDDLIENNNKRIKILEQTAQSIYREWFVKKKDNDWKEVVVNEIANVYRGKSYKGSELSETVGVPFITIKCINRGGGFRFDGLKLFNGQAKESNTLKPGDIVIAVTDMTQERMIVARPARIPKLKESGTFVFSMDLVKVLAKDDSYQNFLYGFFMYSGFGDLVKNYANGVNVLHLSQEHVANAKLFLPDKKTIERYDQIVSPLYKEMDNLQLKNEILVKTKNLLLPKLISGELDVEDLDIKIRTEIL